MSTQVSPAIIMRVREIKESDLLVIFFARDKGLLRGVAKGAKRSLKRFVNCFETFLVNLEYEPRRGLSLLSSLGKPGTPSGPEKGFHRSAGLARLN
jgi:DNA repair protein RecO (recombination protein O)